MYNENLKSLGYETVGSGQLFPSNLTFFFRVNALSESPSVLGTFHTCLVSLAKGQADTAMGVQVPIKPRKRGEKDREEQRPLKACGGLFKEVLLRAANNPTYSSDFSSSELFTFCICQLLIFIAHLRGAEKLQGLPDSAHAATDVEGLKGE